MLIKRIDGFTRKFGAPADWDGKDMSCGVLPVLDAATREGNFMFSAWEPTPPELEALNKGANIILGVRGTVHPVVSVQVAADITPTEKHPDDIAVDQFAEAMKAKLADARAKGRSGWQECDPVDLSYMLREHVEKGDPRDVANFCMFLWSLGKPIGDARPVVGLQLTPLDGIQVWIDAYTNAANGPHFMGHGRIVQLLREYLELRKLLGLPAGPIDRIRQALPELPPPAYKQQYVCTKCGATGEGTGETHNRLDGSPCFYMASHHGPWFTADQMHAYARAYASQLALPAGPVPEGWKLVPIEHTKAMAHVFEMIQADAYGSYQDMWADLLAEYPSPAVAPDTLETAPIGSFAPSSLGGGWTRNERGWESSAGVTFPRPGGDWTGEIRAQPVADERVPCEACYGIGSSEGNFDGADGGDCYVCDGIGKVPAVKNEQYRIACGAESAQPVADERDASDAYFGASHPQFDTVSNRRFFSAGFRAALCQPAEEGDKA